MLLLPLLVLAGNHAIAALLSSQHPCCVASARLVAATVLDLRNRCNHQHSLLRDRALSIAQFVLAGSSVGDVLGPWLGTAFYEGELDLIAAPVLNPI